MPIKWLITRNVILFKARKLTRNLDGLGPSRPCFHTLHDHCNAVHKHQWYSVFHWSLFGTRRSHWYIVRVLCIAHHRPSNYIWDPAIQDNRRRRIPDIDHEDHSQGRKQLRKESKGRLLWSKKTFGFLALLLMTAGRLAAIRQGHQGWANEENLERKGNKFCCCSLQAAAQCFWPILVHKDTGKEDDVRI